MLWRRLEYDFLACFCALLPTFRFSFFFSFFSYFSSLHPGMFIFFCVPSSVQQPFATLSTYVFYSTCSFCLCQLYPTPSRNSFAFLFVLLYSLAYAPTTRTVKVQLAPPAVSSSSVDEVQPVSCCWCSCHPAGVTAETTAEDRSHSSRNHSSTPASTASLSICLLYTSPSPRD